MPGVGTTHQVRLGNDYFLLRGGSYRKMPAPLFGSRFTTGDPGYNNLSLWQYWVQTCWVGGFGAEEWQDEAMYDEALGVDTTQHEVMMLTRDLSLSTGGKLEDAGQSGKRFIIFDNQLYVVTFSLNRLWRWNLGTLTWDQVHDFTQAIRSIEVFNNHLIIGTSGGNIFRKGRSNDTMTAIAKPSGITDTPYTMRVYRGHLYVAFLNQIWRLKPDWTWDGSTVFYTAEDANYLTDAEPHLGFLYFASQNGLILRTDGNNTFEMWRFDPGPIIQSLRSFDGRLFVSVNEPLAGTTAQQAVMYQFTGAAVTELKRWGKVGLDVSTGKLRVYGGKLYFGAGGMLGMGEASGFGVGVYDPREDGWHIMATNRDGTSYVGGTEGIAWTVDDVVIWRGWIWAAVRGHGIFRCLFSYKDASRYNALYDVSIGGATVGPDHGGWLESSDFDAGTPGLQKLWHAITVDIDLPPTWIGGMTGAASTNLFTTPEPHRLAVGQKMRFVAITGGGTTGLVVQKDYFVIADGFTTTTFKVSETAGGPAMEFSANITLATGWRYCTTAMFEYSLDGGVTWGYAGATQANATIGGSMEESGRVRKEIRLQNVGLRSTRLKYRVRLHTTDVQRSPFLRGVIVRYLPIPDPGWQWQMTLVLSEKQRLLDGTTVYPDIPAILGRLRNAFRTQQLQHFVEPDGTEWSEHPDRGVIIHSMEERLPYIGPDTDGPLEYEVLVTLLETAEGYEPVAT